MALRQRVEVIPALASTNVSAITYTTSGTPPVITYSSGGIPQGVAVTIDASDGTKMAVKVAGTTDIVLGINDSYGQYGAVAPGQPLQVQVSGRARVKAHAAITIGSHVVVGASDGTVSAATESQATSQLLVGIALEAAAQAGDYIEVQLLIGGTTAVAS